nr:MAG TPA: hypothetical protein [Caudoviricetes sp.]
MVFLFYHILLFIYNSHFKVFSLYFACLIL